MGSFLHYVDYALPENILSNTDLQEEFPTYDFSKFESKVGVSERRVADANQTALDLAEIATKKLFEKGLKKDEIDFILFCTQSPDYILPTSACILQSRLGLSTTTGALDFNLGCSGYTYGLSLAKALINSNQAKGVLLVTGDTYTKFLHPKDYSNRAIFGDGASASFIRAQDTEGLGNFSFGTDGNGYEHLIIKEGMCRSPHRLMEDFTYGHGNTTSNGHLYMNGPEIFNFTTDKIPKFVRELAKLNNLELDEVDYFIFHQANSFMLDLLRKQLKIPKERFHNNLRLTGNTVSSTIPIGISQYLQNRENNQQKKVMVVGFGVGLSWSGGLLTI